MINLFSVLNVGDCLISGYPLYVDIFKSAAVKTRSDGKLCVHMGRAFPTGRTASLKGVVGSAAFCFRGSLCISVCRHFFLSLCKRFCAVF